MRFFFEVSYKGTNYNGWQSQKNGVGVQAVLEDVLTKIFRTKIEIVGSGRTDAGVHCQQQFFHTDIENEFDLQDLKHRLNSFLLQDIAFHSI